jgi:xanthine/uracil permease
MSMHMDKQQESLGQLFSDLSRDMSTLVRQEVQLAKVEMAQSAKKAGKDAGYIGVGSALAYAGGLAIVATLIIALAHILPWWLASLIVGVVVAVIGYALIDHGRKALAQEHLMPQQTMETLQEDTQWAKNQMR